MFLLDGELRWASDGNVKLVKLVCVCVTTAGPFSFQVLLHSDGRIIFSYKQVVLVICIMTCCAFVTVNPFVTYC